MKYVGTDVPGVVNLGKVSQIVDKCVDKRIIVGGIGIAWCLVAC